MRQSQPINSALGKRSCHCHTRYDPSGNRIALTNNGQVTRFVINQNARLNQVLIRVRPDVTNYYVYGPGLLYEVTETATNSYLRYYHYDYRGSTVALTDHESRVTDRHENSAYGTLTYRFGNTDTPFLFNGRYSVQTDPNGLLYMRVRYYNPYICRFINPDPIGFSGGLNWYAFADGNPVNYLDPFGLCAVGESGWGSWVSDAGWFAADVVLNAELLEQSWYELRNPDFGSGLGIATFATAGVGLVAGAVDAVANVVTLGGKAAVTGGIKSGLKAVGRGLAHAWDNVLRWFGRDVTERTAELPSKLYHYTYQVHSTSITEQGLKPGASGKSFTTPVGTYTPIEAQMYLALPPNQGLTDAVFEIDTATLRSLGIEPSGGPMRVLPTPNAMGYGWEVIFNQPIPPVAIKQIH